MLGPFGGGGNISYMKTLLCIIVCTNRPNARPSLQQSTQAQEKKSDFAFYLFDMRETEKRRTAGERKSPNFVLYCQEIVMHPRHPSTVSLVS